MERRREIRCPQCGKRAYWEGNPFRPFCSERCKLIDLGSWIRGDYVIKGEEKEDLSVNGEDEG